jgi:membrane protease YdiL (CAAX protease family)
VADAASVTLVELRRRGLRGRWVPIVGVILVLAALKVSTALLGVAGVAAGLVATIAVLGVTRAGRATWHDLGVSRQALRTGLVWSFGFFVLFAAGFALTAVAATILPAVAAWVQNLQVSATEPRLVALHAFVTIPLGTVIVEEVAFRSALPTLLGKVGLGTRAAIVASAGLFGLWHVAPSLTVALDDPNASLPVWLVVVGTVVFTTTAGIGLGWLRHRSRSLLPPIVVHMATNSLGVTLLWFLTLGR